MTKTTFHRGWQIMVFDGGTAGRLMMAVKSDVTIHFPGIVIDDAKAMVSAKKVIDSYENGKPQTGEDWAEVIE